LFGRSEVFAWRHIDRILSRDWETTGGFRLVIGYIKHVQIVTTSKCGSIANSSISQFTSWDISVCCVLTSCAWYRLPTTYSCLSYCVPLLLSSLAGVYPTTSFVIAMHDIQQWVLHRLPRHQGDCLRRNPKLELLYDWRLPPVFSAPNPLELMSRHFFSTEPLP
jgi:hypothetical protein